MTQTNDTLCRPPQQANMSTTKPRPLEHRHDISRLHSMAMKQIPDFFRKLTLPTNVPWLDISNEPGFDSKEYYPRAAHLGMILDSATGGLTKVIACLEHIGEVAILTHSSGKPLIRASRLLLGNTMWFAPYCYAANNGERSKQDKIEALIKYYFTDMGYATDFVDVDGKSFQSFKLACNKIAEKLEELKLVQESRDIDRKEAKRSKKPSILLSGTNGYASSSVHTRTNPYTAETDRTVGAGDTDEDEETKSSPTQLRKRPNDDSPVQAKRLKSQHQVRYQSFPDTQPMDLQMADRKPLSARRQYKRRRRHNKVDEASLSRSICWYYQSCRQLRLSQ